MNFSTARNVLALNLAFNITILSVAACALSTTAHAREAQQAMTVRQVYHQVEVQLARSGEVYHAFLCVTLKGSCDPTRTHSAEMWVDARRNLARTTDRVMSGKQGRTYTLTTIYANGKTFTRGLVRAPGQPVVQTRPVFACQGAHIAASVILGCPNPVQKWTMSLQLGRYAG